MSNAAPVLTLAAAETTPAPSVADEMAAELARLRAENAALRESKATTKGLSFKVSEKGAVSVYGLGRWPVTLYREQWERLFAHVPEVKAFIEANASLLSVKPAK